MKRLLILVIALALPACTAAKASPVATTAPPPMRPASTADRPPAPPAPPVLPAPPVPPATVAGDPASVVVVGDSLLLLAWAEVYDAVADGGRRTVTMFTKPASGLGDATFFDWDARLRALDAEARPDQLVVELGTNDLPYPGFYESGAAVGLVMRASGARRVVWVLPSATPLRPERQANMRRIRTALERQAAEGPYADRLDVVDFDLAVATRPGALDTDAIHVTPRGASLLGGLVRAGLDG